MRHDPIPNQSAAVITRAMRRHAETIRRRYGFHACGNCGKPVRVGRYTLKGDGWHWHTRCWREFCGGTP